MNQKWKQEVAHSWFTRFRKLLVRYEKTDRSYLALTMLGSPRPSSASGIADEGKHYLRISP
jgi:hypothetical protein